MPQSSRQLSYEMNFGEYYELYNEAKAADDLDTSHALMAIPAPENRGGSRRGG